MANNARDFIHSLLCPRDEGANFHKMACVQGTCDTCGSLKLFQMREMDSSNSAFVKWKQYEYVIQANESKRLTLVEHSSPPIVFMTTFERLYIRIFNMRTVQNGKIGNFEHVLPLFQLVS